MLLSLRNFATTCFLYAFPRLKVEELKAAKREREKKRREEMKKIYSLGKSEAPPAKTAKPAAARATQAERHSPRATAHKPSGAKAKPSASTPFKPPASTAQEAPQSSGAKVHVPCRTLRSLHPAVARLTSPTTCFPFCRQHPVLQWQPLSSANSMRLRARLQSHPQRTRSEVLDPSTSLYVTVRFLLLAPLFSSCRPSSHRYGTIYATGRLIYATGRLFYGSGSCNAF